MSEPTLSKPPLIAAAITAIGWVAAFFLAPEGSKTLILIGLAVLFMGFGVMSFLQGRAQAELQQPIYLDEADVEVSPVFGPGAAKMDGLSDADMSPEERRATKAAVKAAKKRARDEARFQRQAQKEAAKAAKAAAKAGGEVHGDAEAAEMQEWFQSIRDGAQPWGARDAYADGDSEDEAVDSSESAVEVTEEVAGEVPDKVTDSAKNDDDGEYWSWFAGQASDGGDDLEVVEAVALPTPASSSASDDETLSWVDRLSQDDDFLNALDAFTVADDAEMADEQFHGDTEDVHGDTEDVHGDTEVEAADTEDVHGDTEVEAADTEDVHGDTEDVHGDTGADNDADTTNRADMHDDTDSSSSQEGEPEMTITDTDTDSQIIDGRVFDPEAAGALARIDQPDADAQPVLLSDARVASVASQIAQLVTDAEWQAERRAVAQIEALREQHATEIAALEADAASRVEAAQNEAAERLAQAADELSQMRRAKDDELAQLTQTYEEQLAAKADPAELDRVMRTNQRLSANLEEVEANLQEVIEANRTVANAASTSARLKAASNIRSLRKEAEQQGADERFLAMLDALADDFRP